MSQLGISQKWIVTPCCVLCWGKSSLNSKWLSFIYNYRSVLRILPDRACNLFYSSSIRDIFCDVGRNVQIRRNCRGGVPQYWIVYVRSGHPVIDFSLTKDLCCSSNHFVRTNGHFLIFGKTGKHLQRLSQLNLWQCQFLIMYLSIFWCNCNTKWNGQ